MAHVHYKFSSKLSYATVVFDSPHITLSDLKSQIMGREKLRAADCDLQITSAQTKEEYTDENDLIPKGSSVIVRRIPIIGGRSNSSKTRKVERSDVQHQHGFGASRAAMGDQNSTKALSFFSKIQMANLVDADVSEEDKIRVMINQSAYDSINPNMNPGTGLSANYTCYRCGNSGHHIRNCPFGADKTSEPQVKLKKSTGIPRSFMVEVDDPSIKGAMLTNCGRYAIPAIDAQAYAVGKKEKPPFIGQEQPQPKVEEDPVPDELLCLICRDVLCDAVVIPCCGNSYCDECIRSALLDSQDHVCPTCNQTDVSPDSLVANKFLRQAVDSFDKDQGNVKSLGSATVVPTPPARTTQSQPTSHHSSLKQQDNVPVHPKTVNASQASLLPVVLTTAASDTPCSSPQPTQSQQDTLNNDGKKECDSAASSQSKLVLSNDPTAPDSLSLLNSLVKPTEEIEPLQISINPLPPSAKSLPTPSASLPSPPSTVDCSTGGRNESNIQQQQQQLPPSSSSLSLTLPPLFPPSVLHTFHSAQQPYNSYPAGYNPTRTTWMLPTPQSTPIPSLCSTANSSSSINSYSQRDWYGHQRTRKERSPHRGSGSRRCSLNSHSKSSKSKSSQSYSCSSSRSASRSRSRSHSRSRPHSPYSHRRDRHTRSRPASSYSYGYKRGRSPTPSSSSSPRGTHRSRSKSPTEHHRNHRHRSKDSSSHSSTSKKGERTKKKGIRSALLDSQDHVCPTCNQTDVSPDSLVANKFLRQAVDSFDKDQGNVKSLGSATVVPTPPARTTQSQPTSHHSSLKQQDNVPVHPKTVNASQASLLPVVLTTAASDTPCSSPQPTQSQQDTLNNDGKKECDSAASSQSKLVLSNDPTAPDSLSLLNSPVKPTEEIEPLQISINPLPPSAKSLPTPSASLPSPPSTVDCSTGGRNESNIQQQQQLPPSSSSLSLTLPPLFPPSVLHTFHSAQQPYNSYPAGYNPTRTTWMLPTPQSTPIPSLCSTANSSSSINSYSQRDWYGHQRTRKERSPHRGSGSRRCSLNSHSKSSKSKSSQSYSCSSSRSASRSRSRSHSRSRPHSPYSHRRDRHTRSRPASSYSYGYKRGRSPTPSSSSSPRGTHRSRSKSPTEHHRNHRHRSKDSSSHSSTSKKGERTKKKAVTGESNLYDQHSKHRGSLELELDGERYLQWKKDYTEMCEKYFSAYVSQFHVPPLPPLLTMAPTHYPGWDDWMKNRYSHASDSKKQHKSKREEHSPSSESSGYSRSPSQSSSDSGSSGSQSPSGSHSSHSHVANDRSSPTSQSSSNGHAIPSEDGAQPKECSPLPFIQIKENNAGQGDKITEIKKLSLENVKNNPNKLNKWEEDNRKNENKREKMIPSVYEHDSPTQGKTPVCDTVSESVQTLPKSHSPTGKHLQGKIKEKRKSKERKEKRKISEAQSKQDLERGHKVRTSKEAASVNTTRKQSPVDTRALDSGSQKKRKKEEENMLVNKRDGHFSVDPEIQMRESSVRDRKKLKSERKRQAVTETNIWEGGITVKPQKKISISINLDLKGKGEDIDQKDVSCLEEITEKSEDAKEHIAVRAEDKSQIETDENDKSESNSQVVLQENIKQAQEVEEKQWNQNIFTNSNFVILGKDAAEDGNRKHEQESNIHDALSGEEEEAAGNEEAATARDDHQEQNTEELATSALKPTNENTSVEHSGETQEAELEEETKRWNEEDDKIHDGENSSTTGSEPIVGGGEAEESPEIRASVEAKMENSSGQITDSVNKLELMKISSSKWNDIGEVKHTSTTLPQLSAGKIKLEIKKSKNPLTLRTTRWDQDIGSVFEKGTDKKKNSTSSSSQRTVSPSNGKDRNNSSSYVTKRREPSTERDRSRGRETERNKYNDNSRVRVREKNIDKEGERSYTTSGQNRNQSNQSKSCLDMEGRNWQNEGQRWSSNSSSCPDGNPPGPRSRGSSTSSRYSDWPDHRAHKSHQVIKESVSPDWKHKEKYNSQSGSQDQSKISRHQERPTGMQHHSPPIRSHSHSKEKRSSETSGDGFTQRATQRKSLNESKQERNKWELVIGDTPVKEGKSRRENPECRMGEKKERKEKK